MTGRPLPGGWRALPWRWYALILLLALLVAITQLVRHTFLTQIDRHWDTMRFEIDQAAASDVRRQVEDGLTDFHDAVTRYAVDDAPEAVASIDDADARQRTFRSLRALAEERGWSIELYDAAGRMIAYFGRPVPKPVQLIDRGDAGVILHDGAHIIHILEQPVVSPARDTIGRIFASMPLAALLPANGRFFLTDGLLDRLRAGRELEMRILPDTTGVNDDAGHVTSLPLHLHGRTTGTILVGHVERDAHRASVDAVFETLTHILLVLLLAALSVPIARRTAPIMHHLRFATVVTAHIWLIRIILFTTGIEQDLLAGPLMNPLSFASPFALGLVSSPGSLFLTLLALFLTIAIVYRHMHREGATLRLNRVQAGALAVAICVALPVLLRGIVAAIRSFVIDSALNYHDVASLFDQPMLLLMQVNIALLSGAVMLTLLVFATVARHIARTLSGRRFVLISLLSLLPAVIIFLLITNEFLIPVWIYGVTAFLAFVFLLLKGQRVELRIAPGTAFLILWLLSSVCCAILIDSFMAERRRSDIEARAMDLARPADGWSQALAGQVLSSARMELDALPTSLPDAGGDFTTAFTLWSGSMLSTQPNNSALVIVDSVGRILSEFLVGIDPRFITTDSLGIVAPAVDAPGDTVALMIHAGRRHAVARGRALTADGHHVTIAVVVEALNPVLAGRSSIDVLRNTAMHASLAPEDDLEIRTFIFDRRDGTIRSHEGGIALARGVDAAPFADSTHAGWVRVQVASGEQEFHLVATPGGLVGVAPGRTDWLISFHRFFRLAMVFLLVGLAMRLIARARRLLLYRWFPLRFGARLQLALLTVAAVPILILWFSARAFLQSSTDADLEAQLRERIETMREGVLRRVHGPVTAQGVRTSFSDADCFDVASTAGVPLNVYIGTALSATSNPELYHTGLLNGNLKPSVYLRLHLLGNDFVFAHERIGDFPYAVGYGALRDENGGVVAVLSVPTLFEASRIEASTTRAFAAILLFMSGVLALVFIMSRILSRQISRPLTDLLNGTRAVAAGDYSGTIPATGTPETHEVMDGFNRMVAQLRKQRQDLAAYERELAWRDMAKQVAHEIRNPLTPLRLAVQHLRRAHADRRDTFDTLLPRMTDMMIERIDALANISDQFARFARMPDRELVDVSVAEVLRECVALFDTHVGLRITLDVDDALPVVCADRDELLRVFINLVRNAVQAVGDDGDIAITAHSDGASIRVRIHDNGIGIPDDVLPRIFEPNFSTKSGGMGLGLAIARRAIDDMHGAISVASTPGDGTTVDVRLPMAHPGQD